MATTLEVSHVFDCSESTFWEHCFMNDEFDKGLYIDDLKFRAFDVLEGKELPDGRKKRKVRSEPPMDGPAAVKKLVGDSIAYTEEGIFDPRTGKYEFTVTPNKLADKISIKGTFWVEPKGDNQCTRYVKVVIKVSVFGLGGMVESFIEKGSRESYNKAAAFTQKWIKEKGLS